MQLTLLVLFSMTAAQVTGSSVLVCSPQKIFVWAGGDVVLLCRLQPPISAESMTVEWTRPDLEPESIHVHQDGRFLYESQNPAYSHRTSLFVDELINGNVSLKLSSVTESDGGKYRCYLPSVQQEAFVQLSVGPDVIGSDEPVVAVVGADVILPCHVEPPFDVTRLTVEWKQDRDVVHMYKSHEDNNDSPDDKFRGRTSLFPDEMHKGNISLKLTNVTETDAGNYTCYVRKLQSQVRRGNVKLTVDGREDKDAETDDTHTKNILWIVVGVLGAALILGLVVYAVKKKRSAQNGNHQNPQRRPEKNQERRPGRKPTGKLM